MKKRIVVALGGNAILTNDPTAQAQMASLRMTCEKLLPLIQEGNEIIIAHGNGPQVGNLYLMQEAGHTEKNPMMPLDTCVAMTQGSIGYWIMNALREQLSRHGIKKEVAVLATETVVSADDRAFQNPTKPIGPFFTEEQAAQCAKADGCLYREDSGRGWRKVVPSPEPVGILGCRSVVELVRSGSVVVCGGGGGIPVVETESGYRGVEAVVDKDLTAERIAELTEADLLVICTGVDNVYVNYNKENQQVLHSVTVEELEEYIRQDQFPAGSMLPKIQACMKFVRSHRDRRAIITSLDKFSLIHQGEGTEVRAG